MNPSETEALYLLQEANKRIADLEETIMLSQKLCAQMQVRIARLEKCILDGLTVTTSESLDAWFKEAEALLEARIK